MPSFGQWKYNVDRDATIDAYRRAERGGVDTCDCVWCRNFRLARSRAFPVWFLSLLEQLGINPKKDGEVYHNGRLASGLHSYAGWYHFVGTLEETRDSAVELSPGFTAWMCEASAPRLSSLKGLPVVQLEFQSEVVPWLLNEPEE